MKPVKIETIINRFKISIMHELTTKRSYSEIPVDRWIYVLTQLIISRDDSSVDRQHIVDNFISLSPLCWTALRYNEIDNRSYFSVEFPDSEVIRSIADDKI